MLNKLKNQKSKLYTIDTNPCQLKQHWTSLKGYWLVSGMFRKNGWAGHRAGPMKTAEA